MKEMWNQRFAAEEYYYGKSPNPYFKERIESLTPGRILLPAEGEGRNAVFAARNGWRVLALDFSEEGRKKALKLAKEFNVSIEYKIKDVLQAEMNENEFDAVGLVYFHIPPEFRNAVHKKMIGCLKPGGYIILEAFNKNQLRNSSGGPSSLEMLYNIQLLQEDFAEIDIIELNEYTIQLDAGNGHSGEADVIRLFGRKK